MTFEEYYNNLNPDIKEYFKIICPSGIPTFIKMFVETKTMMRLANNSYFCGMQYASPKVYNFKFPLSRLDHSISTSLITWNNTFDVKQSLAALFHDITTPAFSHVIDYMNGDFLEEKSTELSIEKFIIKDKKLMKLLNLANIKLDDVCDFKKYTIVDNARPKLCADRLDSLFLACYVWAQNVSLNEIKDVYEDICVKENEDGEAELSFVSTNAALKALELNDVINHKTHSDEDYISMNLLAAMTKRLIELNIISYDDLFVLDDVMAFNIIKEEAQTDNVMYELLSKFTNLLYANIKDKKDVKDKQLNPLVIHKRNCERLK